MVSAADGEKGGERCRYQFGDEIFCPFHTVLFLSIRVQVTSFL
jgi:hypothetical protein